MHSNKSGFTIVEALVAMAVFAIVATLAVSIFVNFQRIPFKQIFGRSVQEEATYILEELNYHLKRIGINYAAYGTTPECGTLEAGQPVEVLCIGDASELVYFALGPHPVTGENETLYGFFYDEQSDNPGAMQFPLTTPSVRVTDLRFVVIPTEDPFTDNAISPLHPMLHIFITIEDLSGEERFSYQTLLTIRRYE